MSVPAAYFGVILIWTTTPLAIKWSGEGAGFLFGVTSRMTLGAIVCLALIGLLRIPMPWHRKARQTYVAAGLGIYGAMLSVYWGAQYIPSGWISVVFGLTPMLTAVMASLWLGERALTAPKLLGISFGLLGLYVIFGTAHTLGPQTAYGVGGVLVAVFIHSVSLVWVKRLNAELPALTTTGGALSVAAPLFLITWTLADQHFPVELPLRTVTSIGYLGIMGSVVGFMWFYYVLKHVSASKVALITLITPVSALLLGNMLNGETVDESVWSGTLLILAGLILHQWGSRLRSEREPVGDIEEGL